MLSLFRHLVAPLLATLPAMAQMSASTHLVTGSLTAGTSFAPMPAGAALGNSFSNGCNGSCGTSSIAGGQSQTIERLDFGWAATCQANTTGTTVAEATVRYDFTSPVPFVGRFVVSWNVTAAGTGGSLLEIDLGADGSIDANGATVLPVTFGPGTKSLQLRIRSQATAGVTVGPFGVTYPFQGNAAANLLIRLEPTHCQAQVAAPACGLPQFGVTNNFLHAVKFEGPVRFVDDFAILVLGVQPVAMPFNLQTTCILQVEPMILSLQTVYPGDVPAWSVTLPTAMLPISFRAQQFGFDSATWSLAGTSPLQLYWQ